MKKIISVLALILCFAFLPVQMIEAHPGRTDANGGHTCRTNCEKWGLQYGEYHYHNGGGGSSNSQVKKSAPPKPAAPRTQPKILPSKTIVAVDNANVYSAPSLDSVVTATLWYGFEIKASGTQPEFIAMDQGYVSKTVVTSYTPITPKTVKIQGEKGYFFSTPSTESPGRGYAVRDALVQVVGERGDWYYGSTIDGNGKILVGFVSKSVAY
ncbi:YHYH domain-containing protein [Brevibacillus sp. M2.1A]|uniref:YHYH domain-containing protein n=1 Tax=unclassified Brevibacillus TaxID=2684853 RepID=UPI00156BBF7F|nr:MULTISPECIES: YHYH domain-containing protein [unclassified Brevibacillus]MCC8433296.1 YHYH domain-containing protein [Brevibacillus sp. M2.1A]MCE0452412.1 YHYH domain-containing protein [Brevibacillus sp. AF8]